MFNSKKQQLFSIGENKKQTSAFINAEMKKSAETLSGNGALKYSSSGDEFVDQFSAASRYLAPRPYDEIAKDMSILWAIDPELTIKFTIYLRMITRKTQTFEGNITEEVQKGQGLRHESIFRMIWIYNKDRNAFWMNINLFISAGSWHDIIYMLQTDLIYHGWDDKTLPWDLFGQLILAGLENPNTSQLIKKYLPQIKAKSKCTTVESQADTMIAKWLCSILFGQKTPTQNHYKQYRLLKSSGTAHSWQQLISKGKMLEIDFDTIHGKALTQLVSSKFLKKHGLEKKYEEWILSKPVAKFTGYVHELAKKISYRTANYLVHTINAQYNQLLSLAKVNTANSPFRPICAVDTSASMGSKMYIGDGKVGDMTSIEVAMSNMILMDDMMADGFFKGHYLEFSCDTKMIKLKGNTFAEKYIRINKCSNGNTNFNSVFSFFVKIKKNNNIPEEQFPNMIVCFSDGEFNDVGNEITNIEAGRKTLRAGGFSDEFVDNFGFCFVDLPNTFYSIRPRQKFETFGNCKNCFYFSGYDLAPLGFLFGFSKISNNSNTPRTAKELFEAAMDQEILNKVKI